MSEEEVDTRSADRRQAQEAVQAARALVEVAQLNVEFTQVRAPISGRIGRNFVSVGPARAREGRNVVQVALTNETGFPHQGTIDFVDNRLDPNTGTITVRAVVPNPDLTLTPGLFARVRVPASDTYRALLLPPEAVGSDLSQQFVFVVNDQNLAEYRRVTPRYGRPSQTSSHRQLLRLSAPPASSLVGGKPCSSRVFLLTARSLPPYCPS
jgi:multidrug efflux system membrane fusion protein